MTPDVGQSVGRFRLLRAIEHGASPVFEAEGAAGRCALKWHGDGEAAAQREASLLGALRHPSIPRLVDRGRAPAWLAIEWAEGEPLVHVDSPAEAAIALAQLMGALAHAHARGILHGDLKPANVLIDVQGRLHLLDFGLGERLPAAASAQERGVRGTPAFMAPERRAGGPATSACDLWSAAAVVAQALAGEGALDLARAGRSKEIAVADETLRSLLTDLLETDPAARPASAGEALERLLACLPSPPPAHLAHLNADARLRPASSVLEPQEPPLVGRDGALAQLEDMLRATREGRGAFVVLTSEAGLGRSRLLAEVASRGATVGVRTLVGRCASEPSARAPWHDVLAPLCADLATRSAADIAEMATADARALGLACPEILQLPYVRSLPDPADLSPDLNKFRVFAALTHLLRAWSRHEPLVLLIDDVQWADDATLELLYYLQRNVVAASAAQGAPARGGALSIVLARRRPADDESELLEKTLQDARRGGGTVEILLQRLSPDQVADLVEGMLPGSQVPADLIDLVAGESGGSPQVAVELVRSLFAEGLIRRVRDEWRFTASGLSPAGQLRDMLARRLARVGPAARRLLAHAAVAGLEFDAAIASAASGLSREDADAADAELRAARLVVAGSGSGSRRAIVHEQLRRLVLDDVDPKERAAAHGAVARALEAGPLARARSAEIARQYVAAGDVEGALRHLPQAAAHWRASGNAGEALELLRVQVDLLDGLPRDERARRTGEGLAARQAIAEILQRSARYDEAASAWLDLLAACRGASQLEAEARALVGLGLTCNLAGHYGEAREHLTRALDLATRKGVPSLAVAARTYLVQNAYMQGRFEEGEEHVAAVREAVRSLGNRALTAEALRQIGLFHHFRGKSSEAIPLYREALQLLTEVGDRYAMAATLVNLGIMHNARGELHVATDCYERSLAIFREMGLSIEQAKCLSNIGNVHLQQGAAAEARRCYLGAQAIYQDLGDRRSLADNLLNLGEVDLKRGEPLSALERCRQALAIHRDLGNPAGIAQACYQLAMAHVALGRVEDARGYVAEALELDRQLGFDRGLAYDLAAASLLSQLRGDDEGALRECEQALEHARHAGDRYHSTLLAADLAGLLLAASRTDQARVHASQAHLEATSLGLRDGEIAALLALARCTPGDAGLERVRRAIDLAGRVENPEIAWRAHSQAARLFRDASPREAVTSADRAIELIALQAGRLGDAASDFLARRDVRGVLDAALELEEESEAPRGETVLARFHLLTTDDQRARAKGILARSLSGGLADAGELRRLRAFRDVVGSSETLSLDALVSAFLARALEVVDAERGLLYLRHDDELTCRAALARGGGTLAGPEREVPRQVVERVLREGKALVADDVPGDPRLSYTDSVADLRVKSLLAAPILLDGAAAGVLYVDRRATGTSFSLAARADFEGVVQDLNLLLAIGARAEKREDELRRREHALRGDDAGLPGMHGDSTPMRALFATARVIASSGESVLVTGPSGTGKELLARALHARSRRSRGPFVAIDCGSVPATLMESVLFGSVKGAFTGADRDRAGLFEEATGGTLFLDEITNASLDLQARLLRVLQEREIRRVGGRGTIAVDVRVIAATNLDLEEEVTEGRFRQDLFYRLNVIHLRLPPLSERREDIPLLAESFLRRICEREKKELDGFTEESLAVLTAHEWPGNVRELQNCVARMAAFATSGRLGVERIPEGVRPSLARPMRVAGTKASADVTRRAVDDLLGGRADFWQAVKEPLRDRLMTREQARGVLAEGLRRSEGSYKLAARLFGVPDADYGRFMDFLRFNKLKLDFRDFRARK